MRASLHFDRQKSRGFVPALCSGLLAGALALSSPAFAAGGGGGGGGGGAGAAGEAAELPNCLAIWGMTAAPALQLTG